MADLLEKNEPSDSESPASPSSSTPTGAGIKRTISARSISTAQQTPRQHQHQQPHQQPHQQQRQHQLSPVTAVSVSLFSAGSSAVASPPSLKKQRNLTNYVWTLSENNHLITWTAQHLPQVWVKASVSHAHKIKQALYSENPQITAENIRHKVNNIKAKYRRVRARWLDGKEDSFMTTDVRSKYSGSDRT